MSRWICLMALLFWSCAIIAQVNYSKKVMYGLEVGINNGQQQLRQSYQVAEMRSGLRVGVSLEKPATRRLTFISTMSFVQSGARNVRFSNMDERINYAEFSIKAVEYLPVGGSDLFLSLGPYLSYGINGKVTNNNGQIVTNNPFDLAEYQRAEWGLGGNLGFKTPWGTYLQAGIQTAFNNFYESNESKFFNYSLMLTVGHTIGWSRFKTYRKVL